MTRVLEVTMPDGSVWAVPADLVAEPRAKYYAEHDAREGADYDNVYARELRTSASNLIDWAQNNMDWEEVQPNATMIAAPDSHVDYQEGWINGEMRVVDR